MRRALCMVLILMLFPLPQVCGAMAAGGLLPTAKPDMPKQDDAISILIIGQDTRVEGEKGRADAIMLMVIDQARGSVKLVSFMRDMYVDIPGFGANRINAAYAKGGAPLLKATLEANFGVKIDQHIAFSFKSAARLLSLLGGFTVSLDAREAKDMNRKYGKGTYSEGEVTLKGSRAVYYLRIRKSSGGDFLRVMRQQQVLRMMMTALPDWDEEKVGVVAGELLPALDTSIELNDALWYYTLITSLRDAAFEGMRVPVDGAYKNKSVKGMAVLSPDLSKNKRAIAEFITDAGDETHGT